jgi:hypothetical protein
VGGEYSVWKGGFLQGLIFDNLSGIWVSVKEEAIPLIGFPYVSPPPQLPTFYHYFLLVIVPAIKNPLCRGHQDHFFRYYIFQQKKEVKVLGRPRDEISFNENP